MSDALVLPADLPAKAASWLNLIATDPDRMVQSLFRIRDKKGALVDFSYNRPQRLHKERSSNFDIVLKARKMGISSRRIALDLLKCSTRKHQHRIALTHTGDAADKMLNERVKPFIENCRLNLGAVIQKGLVYFPLTDSRYYIGTAGSKKFGRGDDITGYHFLEYAHWPSPDVVGGIEQALLDRADGLIETTANGHNFFKIDWEAAKRGQNQYKAIFLPWYAEEDYSRPQSDEPGPLTEEEQNIMAAFSLNAEQIAWRRWKKRTMRDQNLFQQEYPETDEHAFLSSGRPVMDWIALARCRQMVSEPKFRGYLMSEQGVIKFVPDVKGPLRIWKMPEKNHVYGIGSDVAEGLKGGAYSTGEVIDIGDSEQVAEWHGHIAPDLMAIEMKRLSEWYNQGVIVTEEFPGPGETTTSHLVEMNAKVWKATDATRYGWQNNRATKGVMIANFNAALRDFQLVIRSPDLLEECLSYIYTENMSMEPSLGSFSDRLIGMGIVWHCTRDLAERVDYYKAPKPDFVTASLGRGGTSVPVRRGPAPGRRNA